MLRFLILFLAVATATEWKLCDKGQGTFLISDHTFIPDPPIRGENFTVIVDGTLQNQVTDGRMKVTIRLDKFPIRWYDWDICTLSMEDHCPVGPGPATFKMELPIWSIVPAGNYTAHAVATDQNDILLSCADMNFLIQ